MDGYPDEENSKESEPLRIIKTCSGKKLDLCRKISGHHREFDLVSANWSCPPFGTFGNISSKFDCKPF